MNRNGRKLDPSLSNLSNAFNINYRHPFFALCAHLRKRISWGHLTNRLAFYRGILRPISRRLT